MVSNAKGSDNQIARRKLLMTMGAGVVALAFSNGCAPIQPLDSVSTTQLGGAIMQMEQRVQIEAKEAGFRSFLAEFEDALSRFVNGDATKWKALVSQSDEATIMGAWGAYEQGWDEVGPRYEWAAARFLESGATVEVEYLAAGVSGELAYTVANERSSALVVGQEHAVPMALRATHLFGMEEGHWKLVHRHADPLMEKTAPEAVLQS